LATPSQGAYQARHRSPICLSVTKSAAHAFTLSLTRANQPAGFQAAVSPCNRPSVYVRRHCLQYPWRVCLTRSSCPKRPDSTCACCTNRSAFHNNDFALGIWCPVPTTFWRDVFFSHNRIAQRWQSILHPPDPDLLFENSACTNFIPPPELLFFEGSSL